MKRIKQFRHTFFISATMLLFSSFALNIFGVGVNSSWFSDFEQGSARIIKTTANCKGKQSFYSGPLIFKNYHGDDSVDINSCSERDLMPYGSQFGLQARVFAQLAPQQSTAMDRYFKIIELLLALISAILFTTLALKVKRQHGMVVAATLLGLLVISPWVVGFARNIYWTLPLLVAPFILTYIYYDRLKTMRHVVLFYVAISLLFLLKLLDGYEHVTTMTISVFAVIVLYEYQTISAWRKLFKPLVYTLSSACIAFVAAVTLNVVGLNEYYHDTSKSLQAVTARAGARSGSLNSIKEVQPNVIYALKVTLPDLYNSINYYHSLDAMQDGKSSPISYFLISSMNYALLPAINLPIPIKGVFGVVLQSMLVVALIGFYCIRKMSDKILRGRLMAASFVGLAGSLSWLVLMPAHAYPHAFLNGIIFYVPFLIFIYIGIGLYINSLFKSRKYPSRASKK